MNEMGKRIKQKRLEHGYTMEELAKKVGVQPSAVNKWEKGIVSNIPRSRIQKIADALECSPIWIMGIDDVDDSLIPTYSSDQAELLMLYNQITDEQKESVLNLLRSFASVN